MGIEYYPREAAVARQWGLHPEEAKPRGETFLHERKNHLDETERLRAHIQKLEAGVNVPLSVQEEVVLREIASRLDLTPEAAMRQALRIFQLFDAGKLVRSPDWPDDSPGCGLVE